MKMENEITAHKAGVIAELPIAEAPPSRAATLLRRHQVRVMRRVLFLGLGLALLGATPAVAAPRVLFPSDRLTVRDNRRGHRQAGAPAAAGLQRAGRDLRTRSGSPTSSTASTIDSRVAIRFERSVKPRARGARDHAAHRRAAARGSASTGSCGTRNAHALRAPLDHSSSCRRHDLSDRRQRAGRWPCGSGEVHDDERDAAAAADRLGDRLRRRLHAGPHRAGGSRPEDRQGVPGRPP
jgi:hypothetical protein